MLKQHEVPRVSTQFYSSKKTNSHSFIKHTLSVSDSASHRHCKVRVPVQGTE